MSVKIRINPVATADIQEIKKYIAEENLDAAIDIVSEIIAKIEQLSILPEMGAMLKHKINIKSKYRYIICGQYLTFYIYEDEVVYVQRVLLGKRDYMSLLF